MSFSTAIPDTIIHIPRNNPNLLEKCGRLCSRVIKPGVTSKITKMLIAAVAITLFGHFIANYLSTSSTDHNNYSEKFVVNFHDLHHQIWPKQAVVVDLWLGSVLASGTITVLALLYKIAGCAKAKINSLKDQKVE